jgi:hypothetical protein
MPKRHFTMQETLGEMFALFEFIGGEEKSCHLGCLVQMINPWCHVRQYAASSQRESNLSTFAGEYRSGRVGYGSAARAKKPKESPPTLLMSANTSTNTGVMQCQEH